MDDQVDGLNDDLHGSSGGGGDAGAIDQEFVDLEDQEPSGSGIGQDGDKRVRSASYLAGVYGRVFVPKQNNWQRSFR